MGHEDLGGFFRPSEELAARMVQLSVAESGYDESPSEFAPILDLARADISRRLWGFLAHLARRNPDRESWPPALQRDLAIPSHERDLVEDLWKEFLSWLGQREGQRYEAPWGTMALEGSDLRFYNVRPAYVLLGDYEQGKLRSPAGARS